MSRKANKTGRSNGEGRHVRLYHWMLESAAWKSLKAIDRAIYIEVCQRFNGANNGFIAYSIREAAASFDIGKSTAARSLEGRNLSTASAISYWPVVLSRAIEWTGAAPFRVLQSE